MTLPAGTGLADAARTPREGLSNHRRSTLAGIMVGLAGEIAGPEAGRVG